MAISFSTGGFARRFTPRQATPRSLDALAPWPEVRYHLPQAFAPPHISEATDMPIASNIFRQHPSVLNIHFYSKVWYLDLSKLFFTRKHHGMYCFETTEIIGWISFLVLKNNGDRSWAVGSAIRNEGCFSRKTVSVRSFNINADGHGRTHPMNGETYFPKKLLRPSIEMSHKCYKCQCSCGSCRCPGWYFYIVIHVIFDTAYTRITIFWVFQILGILIVG